MIPLRDYNPTKRQPVLTLLFIAVNTLVFVQDRLTGHMETTLVNTARGWVKVERFVGGFRAHYALIPANLVGASAALSNVPMVGASGAVAGVMGAYLILYPHARILTFVPFFFFFTTIDVPAFLIIGWWAFIQFANASWMGGGELARDGVAWFAHIGGFLAGMGLLLLVGGKRLRR